MKQLQSGYILTQED